LNRRSVERIAWALYRDPDCVLRTRVNRRWYYVYAVHDVVTMLPVGRSAGTCSVVAPHDPRYELPATRACVDVQVVYDRLLETSLL